MASHNVRQVFSLRSPTAYATTCLVFRHNAIQIHACLVFFSTNDHSSSNSSIVASASLASGTTSVSLKAGSFSAFFLSMRSLLLSRLQMCALVLSNYFALHRLSRSLLFVLLDTHVG